MTFKDQHRPGYFNANAKLAVQAGLGALLACAERLLDLTDLRALEVAHLGGEPLEARAR